MEPWHANLIGVVLGLAIGTAGLAVFLPWQPEPAPPAPQAIAVHPASPPPPTRVMRQATRPPPTQQLQPVELPRVAIAPDQQNTLPNIIHPDVQPSPAPRQHGAGVAGTGFFVASDGTLLTAAHVVNGCRQTRIVSQLVKPAAAEVLAANTKDDIALLRATHVKPPAVLSLGHPTSSASRLFVLGYPASAGPLIPEEAWATLQNDKLEPAPPELIDPRRVIWVASPAIQHGYSGGPMLDPRNGEVVGLVRAMVDSKHLHSLRSAIPEAGMVVGPGSALLAALMRQEGADDDGSTISVSGDDAIDMARRATVHVLCLQ